MVNEKIKEPTIKSEETDKQKGQSSITPIVQSKHLEQLETPNSVANAQLSEILAEVREETIPKAPPAMSVDPNDSQEIGSELVSLSPSSIVAATQIEPIVAKSTIPVSRFKIRITSVKGLISYQFASDEEHVDKLCAKLEHDDNVKELRVFPHNPSSATEERQQRVNLENLATPANPTKQIVAHPPTFYAKPYNISQIDIRDKIQIANFARQILADPPDGAVFGPCFELDNDHLQALVEYKKAELDLAMDLARKANLISGVKRVQQMREEDATRTERKRKDKEIKATKGTTILEKEANSKKLIKEVAQDSEHKQLLQFALLMLPDTKNISIMSKEELKTLIASTKAEMMGKK